MEENKRLLVGFIRNNPVAISQDEECITVYGSVQEDDVRHFFDLDTDYDELIDTSNLNEYEIEAIKIGKGIRIMRQPLIEIMVTALMSPRNTLKATTNIIDNLRYNYGTKYNQFNIDIYQFPKLDQMFNITEEECKDLKMGFRTKHFLSMMKRLEDDKELKFKIFISNPVDAKNLLMSFYGVGDKVADCVRLYALHHMNAFPVDTHIQQLQAMYGIDANRYSGYAGLMHQYLYYRKAILNV